MKYWMTVAMAASLFAGAGCVPMGPRGVHRVDRYEPEGRREHDRGRGHGRDRKHDHDDDHDRGPFGDRD
jgi:hypothetical protein